MFMFEPTKDMAWEWAYHNVSHLNLDGVHCTSLTRMTVLLSSDDLCWWQLFVVAKYGEPWRPNNAESWKTIVGRHFDSLLSVFTEVRLHWSPLYMFMFEPTKDMAWEWAYQSSVFTQRRSRTSLPVVFSSTVVAPLVPWWHH